MVYNPALTKLFTEKKCLLFLSLNAKKETIDFFILVIAYIQGKYITSSPSSEEPIERQLHYLWAVWRRDL